MHARCSTTSPAPRRTSPACAGDGDIAQRDVDAFVAHVDSIAHATKPGYVVLDIAHGISMPTPVQRERVTNAVQAATRATRVLTAHALATSSVTARGVLTAI